MNEITLDHFNGIEFASRDEITALQTRRLRNSLHHAYYHVPYYRRAFDKHGVHPDDFRELGDINQFPFISKADLRGEYPYGMFAVPRERIRRIHASSGTTGTPTVVGYTDQDLKVWADLVARSIHAAGGRKGDRIHVAYGYGLFTGGLGAHYGAEALGATVIPASGGQTEKQIKLIQDFKPDGIMVTPSYLLTIVDHMRKIGVDPRKTTLRYAILGAEPWTDEMRHEIEAALGLDATDIYGLSELMGPGVAQECVETKDGLTVWEDHFYPEIVDPKTGAALPDGERGELVLTSLTREATPVIRFRTHDITRLLPGTARAMRRLERLSGRTDDMMIIRGVNCFPTQFEELILHVRGLEAQYQCILERPDRMDKLTLKVEASPQATADEREDAQRQLARLIKDNIGITVAIDVVAPNEIERSIGKAKRIVDLRGR